MLPLHLVPTVNENLKLGNPGWYRSNDSAVRARRFSIILQGKKQRKQGRHVLYAGSEPRI